MSKIILTYDSKYEAIIWYCNGGLSGRMLSENMLLQKDSLGEYEQLMNTCDHVFSTAEPSGQSAPFNIFQAQKMALPVSRLNNLLLVIRMAKAPSHPPSLFSLNPTPCWICWAHHSPTENHSDIELLFIRAFKILLQRPATTWDSNCINTCRPI